MSSKMHIAYSGKVPFKVKIIRFLWNFVWFIFFRSSPIYFSKFRIFLLKIFGARVSWSSNVYPTVKIWAPWNLIMGPGSCLGPFVICYNVDKIVCSENSLVSQYSHLCTASHDYNSSSFELISAPIKLEYGAWVSADCFIGPGVTIGSKSIILARSIVIKDVPNSSIVSPASSNIKVRN